MIHFLLLKINKWIYHFNLKQKTKSNINISNDEITLVIGSIEAYKKSYY